MDSLIDLFLSRKFPEETRSTLPSNKRIFLDTVLNGNSAPITERDLSPDELKFLANTWKERSEGMLKTIKPYEDALRQRIAKDDVEKNPDRKLRREAREAYERDLRSFDLARQGTYNQDWQNFNKGKLNYWNQWCLRILVSHHIMSSKDELLVITCAMKTIHNSAELLKQVQHLKRVYRRCQGGLHIK